MKTLTTLSLAAALLIGASSVHAEMKPVARVGVWVANAGTTTDDTNQPMCSMAQSLDIRRVYVKWTIAHQLFLHIGKDTWNIPVGIEVPVAIRFDQDAPFKGSAKRLGQRAAWIEFRVDAADALRFIDQFATADKMRVAFDNGNERDWTLRMDGSDTIAQKFTDCVAALKKKYGNPTHPFDSDETAGSKKAPRQPFGSAPGAPVVPKKVPTQPFKVAPRKPDVTI